MRSGKPVLLPGGGGSWICARLSSAAIPLPASSPAAAHRTPVSAPSRTNSASTQARGVPSASMVPTSRVRSNIAIIMVFELDITTMKKMMMAMKVRIPPNIRTIWRYMGESSCQSLRMTRGWEPARRDASTARTAWVRSVLSRPTTSLVTRSVWSRRWAAGSVIWRSRSSSSLKCVVMTPTTSTSIPLSAPSAVTASSVSPPPGLTFIERARPAPTMTSFSPPSGLNQRPARTCGTKCIFRSSAGTTAVPM